MSIDEDPVAWLRAQIEADLKLARRVKARYAAGPDSPRAGRDIWPSPSIEKATIFRSGDADVRAGLDVITMCSPAYVIARCEAELAILDEHARLPTFLESTFTAWRVAGVPEERITTAAAMASCARCHTPVDDAREDEDRCLPVAYPCRTVRLLASGYRYRSGYREAWGPTPGSVPAPEGRSARHT